MTELAIILAVAYNLIYPYWNSKRRDQSVAGYLAMTIINAPNIVFHPFGILVLLLLGIFSLPSNLAFYASWAFMTVTGAVAFSLTMTGLKRTKFFAVEVINKFSFAVVALMAMLVLGERYTGLQVGAIVLGGVGVLLFAWPKRKAGAKFVFDQGVMLAILGLLINSVSLIYYKYAATLAPSYVQFLSGRFVSDIVTWGLVWYISAVWVKRSFKKEFKGYFGDMRILAVSYGIALTNMVSSWLVFVLPASTFSMLLILSMPSAYLLGRHKYQEGTTKRMAAGSVLIALAVVGFVIYK